jgi:DNA-binding MarR family transcriptional regulator
MTSSRHVTPIEASAAGAATPGHSATDALPADTLAADASVPGAHAGPARGSAAPEIAEAPDAPGAPSVTDRELAALAGELVVRIWNHYQARAAELSLSMPEAKALGSLEPGRSLPMRELAARIHASPSNLTVTVDRLEARGLIVRASGDDRRVKSVQLTEAGLALRQRLDERMAADHPALRGLNVAQRAALLELLRALTP